MMMLEKMSSASATFVAGNDVVRERVLVDWPMCEEHIMPGLGHDPRPLRHRPWAMVDYLHDAIVEIVVSHLRHASASAVPSRPPT